MTARNPHIARGTKRHWMDTRRRTRMRAGGSRLHYQQFDYSTSNTESARSEALLSDAPDHSGAESPALDEASVPPDEQPLSPEPANNDELPLFSEREVIPDLSQTQDVPTTTAEAEVSLAGTSAPLLTNPSLTDMPVNVPPLPDVTSNLQLPLQPVTPGYQAPTSCLLCTTSLAQHKQQFPSIRSCICAHKDNVAEDVLEVAGLGGPEDTQPFFHGKLHYHQLHRIMM